ncbi:Group II intron maturase [Streptococcus pneumoniae]|uniref:DNA-3-methyladenine glycosylase I n=1 Tax=Streptococcus pneumoniae TaxID=1313 RepID=UPI0005EA3DFD|nr:DNA-3-methyladenine glycosylase I [Streptococcus pneumoniae]COQ92365.1 Group II intron maturase [Streptococcus pneumoniae]
MNNNFNNFNNMDDLFNQLMGGMRGYSSENRRYLINGREVTPEEFAHYRATGQLPGNAETDVQMPQQASGMKQDGVLAKLGRNLTAEAREGKLDPVIGRNKEIQETSEILSRRTKNNPVLVGDAGVGKTAVVEGLAQATPLSEKLAKDLKKRGFKFTGPVAVLSFLQAAGLVDDHENDCEWKGLK